MAAANIGSHPFRGRFLNVVQAIEPVQIQLTPSISQDFLVLDSNQRPLDGTKIWSHSLILIQEWQAVTNKNGEATLKNLCPKATFQISCDQFLPASLTLDFKNGPLERQNVTLAKSCTLHIRTTAPIKKGILYLNGIKRNSSISKVIHVNENGEADVPGFRPGPFEGVLFNAKSKKTTSLQLHFQEGETLEYTYASE